MSPKVIENDTIQPGTYDFLLVIHSNYETISTVFEINSVFGRERQFFIRPVVKAPLMVLPFVFLTAFAKRTGMRVIPDDVYNCFDSGLITILDGQTDKQKSDINIARQQLTR